MYLYNTTFVIGDKAQGWWQIWMDKIFIPEMKASGDDVSHELYMIDGVQPGGGRSFASQWRTESIATLGKLREVSNRLTKSMTDEKGEQCLAFATMMKSFEP